jgi:[FeFe] hydrogenase (group B1/B3)
MLQGRLVDQVDRIPLEMRPKGAPSSRCCIYRDRVLIRYRIMALLGFNLEEELDELTPLSEYARQALNRRKLCPTMLTVLREACNSCVRSRYEATSACQGCLAHSCVDACPRNAVSMRNGRSWIDPDRCVRCGRCVDACLYHAIVRIPIPCEESCPTGALDKDESGKVLIDYEKCIFCGKCMAACPFSAIMGRAEIIDVLREIIDGQEVVAMAAPAVIGQFSPGFDRLAAAMKKMGFHDVVEVALGADETAMREADEFVERMNRGDRLMTSSCCPAYTNLVAKHVPELKPFVSHTRTPMHYTAKRIKEQTPEAITVFIGPCIAKKREGVADEYVDYVLTFQELDAILKASGVNPAEMKPAVLKQPAMREGRSFPVTGGVSSAVQTLVDERVEVRPVSIDGLTQKSINLLKKYATDACPGNFVEVMGCEGGCAAGPAVLSAPKSATRKIQRFAEDSPSLKS